MVYSLFCILQISNIPQKTAFSWSCNSCGLLVFKNRYKPSFSISQTNTAWVRNSFCKKYKKAFTSVFVSLHVMQIKYLILWYQFNTLYFSRNRGHIIHVPYSTSDRKRENNAWMSSIALNVRKKKSSIMPISGIQRLTLESFRVFLISGLRKLSAGKLKKMWLDIMQKHSKTFGL